MLGRLAAAIAALALTAAAAPAALFDPSDPGLPEGLLLPLGDDAGYASYLAADSIRREDGRAAAVLLHVHPGVNRGRTLIVYDRLIFDCAGRTSTAMGSYYIYLDGPRGHYPDNDRRWWPMQGLYWQAASIACDGERPDGGVRGWRAALGQSASLVRAQDEAAAPMGGDLAFVVQSPHWASFMDLGSLRRAAPAEGGVASARFLHVTMTAQGPQSRWETIAFRCPAQTAMFRPLKPDEAPTAAPRSRPAFPDQLSLDDPYDNAFNNALCQHAPPPVARGRAEAVAFARRELRLRPPG